VPASDAEWRAGDEHARTLDFPSVDAIANGNIRKAACPDIANSSEPSVERDAGVLHAGDGFARSGNAQTLIAIGARIGGDVRVHVNQAWKTSRRGKIYCRDTCGQLCRRCGPHCYDRSGVVEDDDLIREHVTRSDVEQLAAAHGTGRLEVARSWLEESTRLRREIGLLAGAAANMVGLAYIAAAQERNDDALALLDEASAIATTSQAHRILQQVNEARAQLSVQHTHRPA